MDKQKESELLQVFHLWLDCFLEDTPVDRLSEFSLPDIMGYGTTTEEKVFGIDETKRLCLLGQEQKKHLENHRYNLDIVNTQYSPQGESAIIVAEINMSYTYNAIETQLLLRLSTVLFHQSGKWQLAHWHGSVGVESEGDTWHQNEWKRENERLQQKVDEQTAELKQSVKDLKSTQAQLIHSEKMASLGELTAGIAHEIQNPLNFVNNFSELNMELVQDANEEFENEDYQEVKALLKDIEANSEKINHHGKRADSIVKGMLQHSRTIDNTKELTDINALADEYMRLAYHGLRAKDKTFNATLESDFDNTIEPISVIPQDIGRVILNLFTNAFYAVKEKESVLTEAEAKAYTPTVSVTTKHVGEFVQIAVRDNGNGIPDNIKEKIFQPFYTTKPTGQGTGLGLSMSYDIIKAHNGDLKVETDNKEGTQFIIQLPIFQKI